MFLSEFHTIFVHHFPQATLQLVLQSKPWPLWLRREMRSNWAGETGAVAIYRGSHWALRQTGEKELRSFVEEHVAAEEAHLEAMERCLGGFHDDFLG